MNKVAKKRKNKIIIDEHTDLKELERIEQIEFERQTRLDYWRAKGLCHKTLEGIQRTIVQVVMQRMTMVYGNRQVPFKWRYEPNKHGMKTAMERSR